MKPDVYFTPLSQLSVRRHRKVFVLSDRNNEYFLKPKTLGGGTVTLNLA